MAQHWYTVRNIDQIDSPALLVYPERIQYNIDLALKMVDHQVARLRPHIKTHKCREVVQMMMKRGITQFKCATIAEAEMLAQERAPDILMAYAPTGPKLERFAQLIKKYPETHFSCLTDHPEALKTQGALFHQYELVVPVFIDLDLGMHRTGIEPGPAALDLYRQMLHTDGITPGGIHAYDGHLRQPEFEAKKAACDAAFKPVEEMVAALNKEGITVPTIVAGGSPSFSVHAKRAGVQCSPGTFIYWDQGYGAICPEQEFVQAAILMTRVISLPAGNRVTTDLGHKSVASENDISKRIYFQNVTDLQPIGQSEEHLVNQSTTSHQHTIGEVLYGLPYHICPTVALFDRVHVIENEQYTGIWKNAARDRSVGL